LLYPSPCNKNGDGFGDETEQNPAGRSVFGDPFCYYLSDTIFRAAIRGSEVDLKEVADEVANNIGADADELPLTIQVPVDVATTVCGVAADVLQQHAAGGVACIARTTSRALKQIVQRQVKGMRPQQRIR
jgi:hypothetical protein